MFSSFSKSALGKWASVSLHINTASTLCELEIPLQCPNLWSYGISLVPCSFWTAWQFDVVKNSCLLFAGRIVLVWGWLVVFFFFLTVSRADRILFNLVLVLKCPPLLTLHLFCVHIFVFCRCCSYCNSARAAMFPRLVVKQFKNLTLIFA